MREPMNRREEIARARFGDLVENAWASEDNPTRRGYFVRSFKRTGRMNPGLTWEITDGKGKFWEFSPREIGERLTVSPSPQRGLPDDGVREKVAKAFLAVWYGCGDDIDGMWAQLYDGSKDGALRSAEAAALALLDQPPARAEGEWRTIESAPKDGTEVLVSGETLCTSETMPTWRNPGSVGIASFRPSGPTLQWRGEGAHAHDEYLWWRPTHWMPLPAAPPPPGQEGGQPLDATERPGKV